MAKRRLAAAAAAAATPAAPEDPEEQPPQQGERGEDQHEADRARRAEAERPEHADDQQRPEQDAGEHQPADERTWPARAAAARRTPLRRRVPRARGRCLTPVLPAGPRRSRPRGARAVPAAPARRQVTEEP